MLRKILFTLITIVATFSAWAVTDREMEEARAITAKAYLRYANNGSGYLDEITAKSMSELESKLKAKEKENLVAFKSVKVPSDYAAWDKEKLVEFWAVTFFTSPALDANGKAAKSRVRKQIAAMTVSAPTKEAPKETPEEVAAPEPVQPEAAPADQPQEATAEAAIEAQEEILADQEAIQKDAEDAKPANPQQESHTWVYVLVLVILVGIVIWLVVYAANLMKRQPGMTDTGKSGTDSKDEAELRQQTRIAIAKKNEEVAELHRRLQAEEEKSAAIGMELERLKLDRSRLEEKLASLREDNARLQEASVAARQYTPPTHNATTTYEEPARTASTTVTAPQAPLQPAPIEEPRRELQPEQPANARVLKVIYLGRANNRGIFVRADRRINPGNTIYRLDTNDGLVGTFHVVDEPEVVETALSAPMNYLANGCTGEELNDTRGVSRIITESSGTAIFENGYWKVLRKSRIRYE